MHGRRRCRQGWMGDSRQETEMLWADIETRPDYQSFRQRLLVRANQFSLGPIHSR